MLPINNFIIARYDAIFRACSFHMNEIAHALVLKNTMKEDAPILKNYPQEQIKSSVDYDAHTCAIMSD